MKFALLPNNRPPSLVSPMSILGNWSLVTSVLLYGVAFILYALVLRILPLHVAHPILTSGAIVIVCLSSVVFFGARLDWLTIIGLCLIVAGVGIVATRAGVGA
jgi:multidrug transporter EmrE-like cation transporter